MKKPTIKVLEKDIQRACLDFLALKRVFAYKQNNVGIKKPNGSYIPAGMIGVADIVAIIHGKHWSVEVKRPGGKLSDGQEAFRANVERAGGIYSVVHSVDELAAHYSMIVASMRE